MVLALLKVYLFLMPVILLILTAGVYGISANVGQFSAKYSRTSISWWNTPILFYCLPMLLLDSILQKRHLMLRQIACPVQFLMQLLLLVQLIQARHTTDTSTTLIPVDRYNNDRYRYHGYNNSTTSTTAAIYPAANFTTSTIGYQITGNSQCKPRCEFAMS